METNEKLRTIRLRWQIEGILNQCRELRYEIDDAVEKAKKSRADYKDQVLSLRAKKLNRITTNKSNTLYKG